MGLTDLHDSSCVPIVLIKVFIVLLSQACLKATSLSYKRSREVPCISLLEAAGFVLNAICPLEYFSHMAVMAEIVSRRVNDFLVRFLFLCKSVLSFWKVSFGEDFVHQVTRKTSRC